MSTQTITPKSLYNLISKGNSVHLVDVRTPAEFQEIHVDVAKNVPLDQLDPARGAPKLVKASCARDC